MTRLLHVEASPRSEASYSSEVAREFIDAYRRKYPTARIQTLNVWSEELPAFDQSMVSAKMAMMSGAQHTPQEAQAWAKVRKVFDQFADADHYLISTPMWNFGLPYKLKQLIDLVTQPGLAFGFEPSRGFFGLLTERKVFCVFSSSLDYSPGTAFVSSDHLRPHLETLLSFMGIESMGFVQAAPTFGEPTAVAQAIENSKRKARQIASQF